MRYEMVVVAQLVRAPDCGSGGRGFKSRLPPKGKKEIFSQNISFFNVGVGVSVRVFSHLILIGLALI